MVKGCCPFEKGAISGNRNLEGLGTLHKDSGYGCWPGGMKRGEIRGDLKG